MSTIVNGFAVSGICPLNSDAIPAAKILSSLPFSASENRSSLPKKKSELSSLEKLMKPETLKLFSERYDEGYNLETDELYCIWSRFKQLSVADPVTNLPKSIFLPSSQQKVSPALEEILTYPDPPVSKKKGSQHHTCQNISFK